jgi:hypothetical protein
MNGVLVDSTVKPSAFDLAALEAKVVLVEEEKDYQLTAADRCDRCGAQAYVELSLERGKLLFCAHHYAATKAAVLPIVVSGRNETAKLLKRPHIED